MELAGIALRWLQLGCGLGLVGSTFLLLLAGICQAAAAARWRRHVLRAASWLAVLLVVTGAGLLMLQTAAVTDRPQAALQWPDVARLLEQTRYGHVWQARQAAALVLLILLAGRRRLLAWGSECALDSLLLAAAVAQVAASVWTGHGAATEPIWLSGIGHFAHLLAAGIWAGGLPALAYGLHLAARHDNAAAQAHFATVLRRFSVVATGSVLLLVISGATIGYLELGAPRQWPGGFDGPLAALFTVLERTVAPLLSTRYGLLVLAKATLLVPILCIAARVRFVCMPRVGDVAFDQRIVLAATAQWVKTETMVVLVVLLLVAIVSGTLPAAHDQLVWPFPFRFSVAATWGDPGTPWKVIAGVVLLTGGVVAGAAALRSLRRGNGGVYARGLAGMSVLAISGGLAFGLSPLTVDAYPDTYRRTDIAYSALSVSRGAQLFGPHCVTCHGASAKGDGPRASGLPLPPANLTEPHTALHTAGDIFWWLTHGKPKGGMPGFASQLTDDERWDMVNFLRALSAGFQARILSPAVVPGRPWLAPPDFDFSTSRGSTGALKDYRDQQAVLLVFYSWPLSQARLTQLAKSYSTLRARHTEVLALPLPGTNALPLTGMPYPVVSDGANEAARAYLLFRRTLADPGRSVLGEQPPHMEFLIDRFGYARARWLTLESASADDGDWRNMHGLLRQIDLINREPRLLPAPDDHVH